MTNWTRFGFVDEGVLATDMVVLGFRLWMHDDGV